MAPTIRRDIDLGLIITPSTQAISWGLPVGPLETLEVFHSEQSAKNIVENFLALSRITFLEEAS
jgi:hypothetical protein